MTAGRRPRHRLASLLALLVVSLTIGLGAPVSRATGAAETPTPPTSPASTPSTPPGVTAPPSTAAQRGVSIDLAAVAPTVVTDRSATRLTGTITNHGSSVVPAGRVRVVVGSEQITTTAGVDAWTAARTPVQGTEIASAPVAATLAPGQSVGFSIEVEDPARHSSLPYGVLPVSVETAGVAVHTFLGFQRRKEYEPLALAWLVPVTVDPDPALWSGSSATRVAAWSRAVGPKSRVARVLAAAKDTATVAVDPTIVVVPPGTDETEARQEGAERVVSSLAGRRPVVLPGDDLDLGAVGGHQELTGLARTLVAESGTAVDLLDGRSDVAWPVDTVWAPERGARFADLYGRTPVVVVPSTAVQSPVGTGAGRKDTSGVPLAVADVGLSSQVGPAARPGTSAEAGQAFLAHSLVALNLSPGVARSVLVTAPRDFDPDPTAWAAFRRTVAAAPWLTAGSVDSVLTQATAAEPVAQPGDPRTSALPTPATPINAATARRLAELAGRVTATASIRDDAAAVEARWRRQVTAGLSARWRGHVPAWGQVLRSTEAEVEQTRRAVHVEPQTINFLADRGRVQLTVVNELPVEVSGVQVRLVPGNPRLRIDTTPDALRIGPKSRTTVTFDATALAAGPVPLNASVTGPTGAQVGPTSVVDVRVTPTGDAIYVALGAVAALALALGVWRSRRSPRRGTTSVTGEPAGSVVTPDPDPHVTEQQPR